MAPDRDVLSPSRADARLSVQERPCYSIAESGHGQWSVAPPGLAMCFTFSRGLRPWLDSAAPAGAECIAMRNAEQKPDTKTYRRSVRLFPEARSSSRW